jgi:hypothetical protein
LHANRTVGPIPRTDLREASAGIPAIPPHFCRLNQYSTLRGASWEQADCPRSPVIVAPGRLTTSKLDSNRRRPARAPRYGTTHFDVFRVPFGLAHSLMEAAVDEAEIAAVDEAEIDDWLIEEILELLNDALGG